MTPPITANNRGAVHWYQLGVAEVLQRLGSNAAEGLTEAEARGRLEQYGPNQLIERGGRSRWQILWTQLTGILTLILIAAAVVSFFLGDYIEAVVILLIVVLNALLGFSQEYKAEQSMAALKRMSVPTVRVRRGGRVQEIPASHLVLGDVVLLETGNIVPADGRVLASINLRAQEAALTGESEAVDKEADLIFETEKALGDRRNLVYSGAIINYGHGEMVVTATGMQTELGKIADLIQSVEQEQTPLQGRLDRLGRVLAIAALVLVAVIFLLGWLRGGAEIEELLLTAVSLAVAAIPEAMTAVVTITLSLGAQRMLKRQALIRRLPAVETLGSVSIICSDKTGTLTQNRMTVTALDIANHRVDLVQRPGEARLELVPVHGQTSRQGIQPTLDLLLIGGALCNDAILQTDVDDPHIYRAVGDPTEGALALAAAQVGLLKDDLDRGFPRVAEWPFDSVRKRMTTVNRMPQSREEIPPSLAPVWERRERREPPPPYLVFTKGAIDGLLAISKEVWVEGQAEPLTETWRAKMIAAHDRLAANGMRVLAVGMRPLERAPGKEEVARLEQDLILVGLFGLIDPPRPEVKEAVQICQLAGIRPVMITGDHPLTARHIAKQLGIGDNDFLTGQELDELSPEDLKQKAQQVSVFARVSPEHKLKLIQAYQEQGLIVSMTGDGVNDAPALKKADIGVAMGITGTDVAKEASDMVLLDDNFATIVAAVEEGRVIYDNIRRFIKYLLSCNASEIAVMLFGPFLGMPLPLLPLQILWMNLVTDGLPALALSVEPAEKGVMKRPPYSSTESVFGRGMGQFIMLMGVVMSLIAVGVGFFSWRASQAHWQTLLFTTLIFAQLALGLAVRSEEISLFKLGLLSNKYMAGAVLLTIALQLAVVYVPFLQRVFTTTPLTLTEIIIALGLSLLVVLVVETQKWLRRRR